MNDFDQAARHATKLDPPELMRWLLPRLLAKMKFRRWLDSQSAPRPGEPDRRCDTIAEVVDEDGAGPPWAVVIELFTGPDADAIDRCLEYLGRFRREMRHGPYGHDRYQFAVVLVFLTTASTELALDMALPGQEDVVLKFAPALHVLAHLDAVDLLDWIEQNLGAAALLCWVPLLRNGDDPAVVARWRQLAMERLEELPCKTITDLALVFTELTKCQEVWRKGLEGFNVNESKMMREMRQEGRQEMLLHILKSRYSDQLPAVVLDRVQAQTDPKELQRWADLAMRITTVEEFTNELGKPSSANETTP